MSNPTFRRSPNARLAVDHAPRNTPPDGSIQQNTKIYRFDCRDREKTETALQAWIAESPATRARIPAIAAQSAILDARRYLQRIRGARYAPNAEWLPLDTPGHVHELQRRPAPVIPKAALPPEDPATIPPALRALSPLQRAILPTIDRGTQYNAQSLGVAYSTAANAMVGIRRHFGIAPSREHGKPYMANVEALHEFQRITREFQTGQTPK